MSFLISASNEIVNAYTFYGLPGGLSGEESICSAGAMCSIPGSGRSLGEENGNHSSIPAWRIPRTEEPGGLQSMGLQELDMTE